MYKATQGGSVTDDNGRVYRFSAGGSVDAPKGKLDHCKALIWIEDSSYDNDFENLPDDVEFPYHYGAGNYFLSDGSKVSGGKEVAIKAQQELDES